MTDQKNCSNCLGVGWVCENHLDQAWEHPEGCDCGAGAPCPVCNHLHESGIINRAIDRIKALPEPDSGWNDFDERFDNGVKCGRDESIAAVCAYFTPSQD